MHTNLPIICGHRGAPVRAKENTPESYLAAAQDGATWIELDIRLSREGIPVVHHDPTVATLPISSLTVRELQQRGVYTFADILTQLPAGLNIDVEIKLAEIEPGYQPDSPIVQATYDVICQFDNLDDPQRQWVVTSFNPFVIQAMHRIAPQLPIGLLTWELGAMDSAKIAKSLGATYVAMHYRAAGLTDPDVVAQIKAMGLTMLIWTIDDPALAVQLMGYGVDIFCTNDPHTIVSAAVEAGYRLPTLSL